MSACGVRPSVCHVRELLTSRASVFITSQDAAAQLLSVCVTYFTASPGLIRYQVDESCRYCHVKYGILQVPSCRREAARCLVTYRHWSVSLWRDLTNWMNGGLSRLHKLRMKTMFRGWTVMVHDTHTRRLASIVHYIAVASNPPRWSGRTWPPPNFPLPCPPSLPFPSP